MSRRPVAPKTLSLGDEHLSQAVDSNAGPHAIRDMRDTLNEIEMYSARVKDIAEAKWDKDYPNFPLFLTTALATADLSETVKPLDKILEEAQKNG